MPKPVLCETFNAWGALISAATAVDTTREPFRYDLVNLGREILARLSTPMSQNFTNAAFAKGTLDAAQIAAAGDAYVSLLLDLDALVATDDAFLLGPVIRSARSWAGNASDCQVSFDPGFACADFYE
jgi:alpha-N-acetylglucosaminidase